MASLPYTCQSQSPSPYFDLSLFRYDEKVCSTTCLNFEIFIVKQLLCTNLTSFWLLYRSNDFRPYIQLQSYPLKICILKCSCVQAQLPTFFCLIHQVKFYCAIKMVSVGDSTHEPVEHEFYLLCMSSILWIKYDKINIQCTELFWKRDRMILQKDFFGHICSEGLQQVN